MDEQLLSEIEQQLTRTLYDLIPQEKFSLSYSDFVNYMIENSQKIPPYLFGAFKDYQQFVTTINEDAEQYARLIFFSSAHYMNQRMTKEILFGTDESLW